ncbi:uncharacterized protein TNCV_4412261 [Trichonephila clavipes]|nr:uncharacterized protein TNCV_4412261 [Trichonephila clavipes]
MSATKTYDMTKRMNGSYTLPRTQAFEWHHCFKESRESVEDDRPSVRPPRDFVTRTIVQVGRYLSHRSYEGESSSDENNEEKHRNICNGKKTLDPSLPLKSPGPIHFIVLAVTNSWLLCKRDGISNKIPENIKVDRLKFKFEIVEALAASLSLSLPTKKSILTDDEVNSVVISLAKRPKRYNPSAMHVMAFILAIPG